MNFLKVLSISGRTDDFTKVKGVQLAPTAIEEVARSISELCDEYEVVTAKKGDLDDITLIVECFPEIVLPKLSGWY